MDQTTFMTFVAAAASRAVGDTIGRLVLTQTAQNGEPSLREPEMRHALAQEAEARPDPVHYGIEVPTKAGYRFTPEPGERETSARHDFVVLAAARHDAARENLLELKKGQAGVPKIRKDLQKLLLEGAVDGKSMLHICHAAKKRTIAAVLDKYNAALPQAVRLAREAATRHPRPDLADDPCWFSLFVLVVRQRGRAGGNHPALYHQGVAPFGAWLARVEAGEDLFRANLLQEVPLPG